MGVSGSGKTTFAKSLSQHLGWRFVEADDFHSDQAKAQMQQGIALTDEIRLPWIGRICDHIRSPTTQDTVLAYSGLKEYQRDMFRQIGYRTLFILLHGDFQFIESRMKQRAGHFMPPSLLKSQFDALEMPRKELDCIILDIAEPNVETQGKVATELFISKHPTE